MKEFLNLKSNKTLSLFYWTDMSNFKISAKFENMTILYFSSVQLLRQHSDLWIEKIRTVLIFRQVVN